MPPCCAEEYPAYSVVALFALDGVVQTACIRGMYSRHTGDGRTSRKKKTFSTGVDMRTKRVTKRQTPKQTPSLPRGHRVGRLVLSSARLCPSPGIDLLDSTQEKKEKNILRPSLSSLMRSLLLAPPHVAELNAQVHPVYGDSAVMSAGSHGAFTKVCPESRAVSVPIGSKSRIPAFAVTGP